MKSNSSFAKYDDIFDDKKQFYELNSARKLKDVEDEEDKSSLKKYHELLQDDELINHSKTIDVVSQANQKYLSLGQTTIVGNKR